MKNIIGIVTLLLISVTSHFGQEVRFGANFGLNMATIAGGPNTAFKPSGHIGGFAQIKLEKFVLQPEFQISGLGAIDLDNNGLDGRWSYTYIAIPVLAKLDVNDELFFHVGPQISFLANATYKQENALPNRKEVQVFNIEDDTESIDISLVLGAGYQINDNINIGLRFVLSFVDHNERNWTDDIYKNQLVQIGGGYRF